MGKTLSTGLLTNGIWQDASNNIGLGAPADASFKLKVTGATNLTGVLTLGSTISNGTHTYTLPSATGTLALVSQIPSIAGLVPTSRVLTINGVSYNLTADASWTIAGGVTSFNTRTGAITLLSADVTGALGFTPYNATNPSSYVALGSAITGYTLGANAALAATDTILAAFGKIQGQINARGTGNGTVTSVGGTGTVSGLTLTGTVTSTGNLTLGGTLSLTSANVTGALGFTPYNATNPSGFITSSALSAYLPLAGGTMTGTITITNTDIRSNAASNWTGDPGAQGKIQYHSNRWYIVADSSSDRIVQFRRNGTDTSWISNDGTFIGSISGNAGSVNGYSVAVAGNANTIPTRNSSGYLIPENWIQFNGQYGIYSPTNSAHFFPNDRSYGSWKVLGERNGWRGLHFGEGTGITLMMNEGEFGFHREAVGWVARFTSGHFHGYANSAGSISGQANSATINATSGNAGNNIVLRDGNGDIAIGTLNTNHAFFGGGGRGLTSADTYGSYGNVMTYGTGLNGWHGYGIHDNAGYRSFFMSNNGNFGIYGQTIGQWAFYYSNSTASYSIGSSNAVPGYTLYLIYGLYTVGLFNASDARMKKNVSSLSSSLDKVKALRGVSYEYIDNGPDGTKNKGTQLGFIAQEVLPVVPELVRYDDKKGYAMNYNGVSAVLVEAIKEQQIQIENQQNQIDSLTLQLTEILNR